MHARLAAVAGRLAAIGIVTVELEADDQSLDLYASL
jgi:hypothetical protein